KYRCSLYFATYLKVSSGSGTERPLSVASVLKADLPLSALMQTFLRSAWQGQLLCKLPFRGARDPLFSGYPSLARAFAVQALNSRSAM
ncbi:hypothetical protein, partial [Mesorhizobium sp.]|uniref:hypothetical protein n=1 Tax=Mesorhizobium sp. TaxID=1871066 RepID=UPI0025876C27